MGDWGQNMGGNIEISHISGPKQAKGSPRLEFAVAYLRDNPDAMTQTGGWLQANAPMPSGVNVSYRTWGTAKNTIRVENDNG